MWWVEPDPSMVSAGVIVIAAAEREWDLEVDEAGHHDLAGVGADAGGGGAGGEERDGERERGANRRRGWRTGACAWGMVLRPERAGVWKELAGDGEHCEVHESREPERRMYHVRRSNRSTRFFSRSGCGFSDHSLCWSARRSGVINVGITVAPTIPTRDVQIGRAVDAWGSVRVTSRARRVRFAALSYRSRRR